jgi:hypothetical protein
MIMMYLELHHKIKTHTNAVHKEVTNITYCPIFRMVLNLHSTDNKSVILKKKIIIQLVIFQQ